MEIHIIDNIFTEIPNLVKNQLINNIISFLPEHKKNKYINYKIKALEKKGENVGMKAIQSIMAGATQSSLSSFHKLGKNINENQPSTITDILDMKGEQKRTMIISIKNESFDNVIKFKNKNTYLTISDFKESMSKYSNNMESWWYKYIEQKQFVEIQKVDILNMNSIRIFMDVKKMSLYNLSCKEITDIIEKNFTSVIAIPSPSFLGIIDIHPKTISDNEKWAAFVNIFSILKMKIRGIEGMHRITPKFDIKKQKWVAICSVSSICKLSDILTLNEVDKKNTYSNNVEDVRKVLGIEAAREIIKKELSRSAKSVSGKHITLIADFMCWSGYPTPFTKAGLGKDLGFLSSMAMERPKSEIKEIMNNYQYIDNLYSIHSKIIVGNL